MDVRRKDTPSRGRATAVTRRTALGIAGAGLAAASGLARAPRPVAAQATPAATPKVVERWAAAWNAHDPAAMAALFTDDGVYEDLGFEWYSGGKAMIASWVEVTTAGVADVRIELVDAFQAGHRATAVWNFAGTHTGSFAPDLPPTGRAFSVRAVSVFELEGDLLRRVTDFYNLATWQRQLGPEAGPYTPVGRPIGTPPPA